MGTGMVEVRGLHIGEGIPKICVPVMGNSLEQIEKEAKKVLGFPADIVEWRGDFMEQAEDVEFMISCAERLRNILGELPLLFTFRTKAEGGEQEIPLRAYQEMNRAVAESNAVDMVDIEMFRGDCIPGEKSDAGIQELAADIHKCGKAVVGSYHDFSKTPKTDEMVSRLVHMKKNGADIPKLAVMPKSSMDVCRLLSATVQAKEMIEGPVITMSMAGVGSISRVSGEFFGSAVTFGCLEHSSAPGQMPVEELAQVLAVLHGGCR